MSDGFLTYFFFYSKSISLLFVRKAEDMGDRAGMSGAFIILAAQSSYKRDWLLPRNCLPYFVCYHDSGACRILAEICDEES